MMKWMLLAVTIAAVNSQFAVRSYAGLFKIDFGQLENEKEILDADGNPTGMFPEPLTNWNVIPTWTFTDPNVNVATNSASIVGTTNAAGTEVTWKLKDFSTNGDNDVMVASSQSHALAERIPNSKLVIYPDSGHGGIFQYHERFVPAVLEFLDADDPVGAA